MLFKSCFVNVFTVTIIVFIIRSEKKLIVISLFKKLIHDIQNNLHVDVDYVDNRLIENKNEAVETHVPRHRNSKKKKSRDRGSKAKKLRHWDSGTTKTPQHRETESTKPRHHDCKPFFQRPKSHNIEIPRLKNHDIKIPRPKSDDIEFLWNSDPYSTLIAIVGLTWSSIQLNFAVVNGRTLTIPLCLIFFLRK